jgi:hypothetical protein
MYEWPCILYNNDEKNQLDATTVIYHHKLTLHVSGIYMPNFRSTGCNLLHVVFSTVRENQVLVVDPVLFSVLRSYWCRLWRQVYWVEVLHDAYYSHWSGWNCGCEAGVWCGLVCVMNFGCQLSFTALCIVQFRSYLCATLLSI